MNSHALSLFDAIWQHVQSEGNMVAAVGGTEWTYKWGPLYARSHEGGYLRILTHAQEGWSLVHSMPREVEIHGTGVQHIHSWAHTKKIALPRSNAIRVVDTWWVVGSEDPLWGWVVDDHDRVVARWFPDQPRFLLDAPKP